ncbi:hypothetical protein LARI1_G007632 [Lachnellula arida]|uniref:Uncharacterized protein n=1 Tax=Lachnellula arida TaxID=1316785 RepID=A0A8T9B4M2_9HELO|nr:hypothetical protein LARI1_G007632 [Lachnellula arida]
MNPIYNTHSHSQSQTILPPRTLSSFIHLNNTLPPAPPPTTAHSTSTQLSGTEATATTTSSSSSTTLPTSANSSTTSLSTTTSSTAHQDPSNLKMHHNNHNRVVETRTTKPTLMTRLRGRNANTRTVKTTTKVEPAAHHHHNQHHTTHATHTTHTRGHAQPVHHHKRRVSVGDKFSGAMMKLRGSLTRRPGLKAAGTRRMHGTDGRGSHRTY